MAPPELRGLSDRPMALGARWQHQPVWAAGEAARATRQGLCTEVAASPHVLTWAAECCNAEGSELWNNGGGLWGIYSYMTEVFKRALRTGAVSVLAAPAAQAEGGSAGPAVFRPDAAWLRELGAPLAGSSPEDEGQGRPTRALVFATSVLNENGLPLFALVLPTALLLAEAQAKLLPKLKPWSLVLLLSADELASPPPIPLSQRAPGEGSGSAAAASSAARTLADILEPLHPRRLPRAVKFYERAAELSFDVDATVVLTWDELPPTASDTGARRAKSGSERGGAGPSTASAASRAGTAGQEGGTDGVSPAAGDASRAACAGEDAAAPAPVPAAARMSETHLRELLPKPLRDADARSVRASLEAGAHWAVARARADPRTVVAAWRPEHERMELLLPLPILRGGRRSAVAETARAMSRLVVPCKKQAASSGSASSASDESTSEDDGLPWELSEVRERYEAAEEESLVPAITLAAVAVRSSETGDLNLVGILPLHEAHCNARLLGPVAAPWLKAAAAFAGGAIGCHIPFGCAETLPASLKPVIASLMGSRGGRQAGSSTVTSADGATDIADAAGAVGGVTGLGSPGWLGSHRDDISVAGSDDTRCRGSAASAGGASPQQASTSGRRRRRGHRSRVARAPALASGLAGVVGIESHAPPARTRILPPVAGSVPALPLGVMLPVPVGPQRGQLRTGGRRAPQRAQPPAHHCQRSS